MKIEAIEVEVIDIITGAIHEEVKVEMIHQEELEERGGIIEIEIAAEKDIIEDIIITTIAAIIIIIQKGQIEILIVTQVMTVSQVKSVVIFIKVSTEEKMIALGEEINHST